MWKTPYLFLCITLFIFLINSAETAAVPDIATNKIRLTDNYSDSPKSIFLKVEEGLAFGEIEKFSSSLSSQTYLSLSNGVTGYYSPNQAFYVLQDYINIYKPVSFRFITMYDKTDNPYASGYYKFESKGIRGTAQVYIALKLIGNNWKISQITIN
jgi:hypothetical protein